MHIADFHCDLLSYLEREGGRSAYDPESRASIPFLRAGGVELQTLPIFSKTHPGSVVSGSKQFEIFLRLPQDYPEMRKIKTVLAVENASCFCDEKESLEAGLERIKKWHAKTPIAYISLTWNDENRFGGGNSTQIGLKPDGLELLRWMSGKNIAIDLSHTSDQLAEDILKAIDNVTPIASHSNFRSVVNQRRNLPDSIAKEIGERGGIIGLNFVRSFVEDFVLQVKHAQKLGLLDHYCFGADFFEEHDVPPELNYLKPFFYDGFDTSACYPKVVDLLLKHFPLDVVEKIAYRNLTQFLGVT